MANINVSEKANNLKPMEINNTQYTTSTFKLFINNLLSHLVDKVKIQEIRDKIVNLLDDKMTDEIMMNISVDMFKKLTIANDAFKKITDNSLMKKYSNKWNELLFKIAKLQGLIILKRVKKVAIDPSIENKDKLIEELIKASNDKLKVVNNILLTDLNSPPN
jgi:hypothetical protein